MEVGPILLPPLNGGLALSYPPRRLTPKKCLWSLFSEAQVKMFPPFFGIIKTYFLPPSPFFLQNPRPVYSHPSSVVLPYLKGFLLFFHFLLIVVIPFPPVLWIFFVSCLPLPPFSHPTWLLCSVFSPAEPNFLFPFCPFMYLVAVPSPQFPPQFFYCCRHETSRLPTPIYGAFGLFPLLPLLFRSVLLAFA